MKKIGIVMGSDSDMPVVSKAIGVLREYGVPYEVHVYSAHRTPEEARDFALTARERGLLRSCEPISHFLMLDLFKTDIICLTSLLRTAK